MVQQLNLFADTYRTLEDLRKLVTSLHWTGGMNEDGSLQYIEYQIDFHKDLAFIVVYEDTKDNNEKVIDNCIELKRVEDNLYRIIRIDGKTLGDLDYSDPLNTRPKQLELQNSLIKSMEEMELFIV